MMVAWPLTRLTFGFDLTRTGTLHDPKPAVTPDPVWVTIPHRRLHFVTIYNRESRWHLFSLFLSLDISQKARKKQLQVPGSLSLSDRQRVKLRNFPSHIPPPSRFFPCSRFPPSPAAEISFSLLSLLLSLSLPSLSPLWVSPHDRSSHTFSIPHDLFTLTALLENPLFEATGSTTELNWINEK